MPDRKIRKSWCFTFLNFLPIFSYLRTHSCLNSSVVNFQNISPLSPTPPNDKLPIEAHRSSALPDCADEKRQKNCRNTATKVKEYKSEGRSQEKISRKPNQQGRIVCFLLSKLRSAEDGARRFCNFRNGTLTFLP